MIGRVKVKNMRDRFGVTGLTRLFAAAVLAAGALFALAGSNAVQAYSGAQAEAQSDPRSVDPYSFPNIDLCCKTPKKKKKPRRRGGYGGGGYGDNGDYGDYDDGDYSHRNGRAVRVSCGAPQRYSYSSISEALEHVREGGRIVVRPGAPCDVSGLTIDQGITIESDDYEYGGRADLRGNGECVSISPSYASSVVSFRGVDIDGCLTLQHGRLDFKEVNLASRSSDDAVRINGGTFSSTDSTIRARGTAINAKRGVMVSLTGGGFASGARAEHVIRLEVDGANLQNTMIKGGQTGVYVGMQGRYPVTFSRVQVVRGEASEIYQIGPGKAGIVIGGSAPGDDLPSLPNLPGTSVSIEGGVVGGYVDGIVFSSGVRGAAKGVNIVHPGRGIVVEAGAAVDLRENKITHAKRTGIHLAGGASGSASFNDIQCDDGHCVCYDGECTSRSDREFGRGAFRMSGTRCDD